MKYVVIGGAGAMGRITVKDLVETAPIRDEIIIADYDMEKAQSLAKSFTRKGVSAVKVDVNNLEKTVKDLSGASIIINCVQYQYNIALMEIALALNAHYVDLGGLFYMTRQQMELHKQFKDKKKTALIGMGAAPGITNIMARFAADELDIVKEIHIRLASKDQTRYVPKPALATSYSLKTILQEFSFEPAVFTKGKFKFVKPMSGAEPHRFPLPVGIQSPMYTLHSEVATLPLTYKNKGIKEVSFKIAFAKDFTEKVKFLCDIGLSSNDPLEINGSKVAPIDVVNRLVMSQAPVKQVGPLKQYEVVRSVVKGTKNSKKITWIVDCHTTGKEEWNLGTDINTGSPPSIAAQMILNGDIKGNGVVAPEVAISPVLFFEELKKRNMFVKSQKKDGWSFEV
jgi:saccharopine dehydrogenase-like NADP-dependent oxidoreductase